MGFAYHLVPNFLRFPKKVDLTAAYLILTFCYSACNLQYHKITAKIDPNSKKRGER